MPRQNYRPWSNAEKDKLRELCATPGMESGDMAVVLGRSLTSVRTQMQALGLHVTPKSRAPVVEREQPTDPDAPEFSSPLTSSPLSVEDIVALFKIDLSVWEPYHIQPNVWQVGSRHPESGEVLTENLYQTKVRFRRKPDAADEELAAAVLEDVRAETRTRAKARAKLPATGTESEPHMAEVAVFDAHLNKLSWEVETGENFDTNIAFARVQAAVSDLLAMSRPYFIECITLPVGNDFTNIDGLAKQTTAGTPQDTDTRYHRMFRRARSLGSWMIEVCAQIAPVQVVIVPGNHDELTAWTLGQVLEAEYANDSRVTFQSGPRLRKYVEYGANLIGYTHGVDEPHGNLPQIMAIEQPESWARSTHREWHVGHLHKQKATGPIIVDDKIGATVRIIRSLSGTDAWHFRKGYVGGVHGAEAFIWKKSGGLRAHLFHTVEKAA